MGLRALIRNGMGDSDLGTGAEEDDFLYFSNYYLLQEGYVNSGDFAVSQRGAGANMSVDVAKGKLFIPNSSWLDNTDGETKYWAALNDAVANLTVTANSSGNPRIDIVIVTLNTATAPDDEATNVVELSVVAGTPAGSPVAPTTPANSYKLAEIAVANGAVSVVTANITDTRDYAYLNLSKGVIPSGETLKFFGVANTEFGTISYSDGSGMIYGVSADNHYFNDENGDTVFGVGTAAANVFGGFSFYVYSAGNDKYLRIHDDDTNVVFQINSGSYYFNDNADNNALSIHTDHVTVHGGSSLYLENSGATGNVALYNLNDDLYLDPGTNGQLVVIARMPRDNSASATYQNVHIQRGWGFVEGDANEFTQKQVTFPVAYSSGVVTVLVDFIGIRLVSDGAPTSEAWFQATDRKYAHSFGATATDFWAEIRDVSGANNVSTLNYGYSWIAIGPA